MTLRIAVLTVSDRSSRGEREDISGPKLGELVLNKGWQLVKQHIVSDDRTAIREILISWAESKQVDIILVTGGTGFAPRDITPEATRDVVERFTPGLDEAMRAASLQVTPHAMLSRGVSGIRKKTLIINLPGSPKGAVENFQVVLPALEHGIKLIQDKKTEH